MASSVLIDRFSDVPLEVSAAISFRPLRVAEILGLQPGDVLSSDVPDDSKITVYAGGARIGVGQCSGAARRVSVRMTEIGCGQ